jgi:hypothetical protein
MARNDQGSVGEGNGSGSGMSQSRNALSRFGFAALVILMAGALVLAWAMRDQGPETLPATRGAQLVPADRVLHALERETAQAVAAGRVLEMIKGWQEFVELRERANPLDPALGVGEEYIRWLRSQIDPLQATDDLVRRRLDRAQYMLNIRRPALAAAYTEKTGDLFGRSSTYTERVEILRRSIDRSTSDTDPGQAQVLIERANQILNFELDAGNGPLLTDAERQAEGLLLQAIQSEPGSFSPWMEAGKFYARHHYHDDARVCFMVAGDKATNGSERGTATQQLELLPSR